LKNKQSFKKNISFIKIAIYSTLIIILIGIYVGYLTFNSKNSYNVYATLQKQKNTLQVNINILQEENAKLQKEFFELKNLEPEWIEN
jgi:cell division protein FtsB